MPIFKMGGFANISIAEMQFDTLKQSQKIRISMASIIGVSVLLLSGCATPYQDMGLGGGVAANRITSDTFQVVAAGNGYTDAATIQRYVIRKAAEATLAAGFDYFALGEAIDQSSTGRFATSSAAATRHGVFASAFSTTIYKPGESVMVKAFRGAFPNPAPDGYYDAKEVVAYLGKENRRGGDLSADRRDCHEVGGAEICDVDAEPLANHTHSVFSYSMRLSADAHTTAQGKGFSIYFLDHHAIALQPHLSETFKRPAEWPLTVWREAAENFVKPYGCGISEVQVHLRSGATWEATYICPNDKDISAIIRETKK